MIHHSTLLTRLTTLILVLLLHASFAHSENADILPDSSNFVKASLLVSTPTDIIYSSLGHCAIRMECPTENLDYCFSLETNVGPSDYVRFFKGDTDAAVRAVPSAIYIEGLEKEGRGIKQYEFNLNWHEKQLLWKNLDEEMMKPPHLKFNYLNTNCVTMIIVMLRNALIDEQIDYGKLPSFATSNNGDCLRQLTAHTPWYEFIYITLFGRTSDLNYALEYRMSPMGLVELYEKAQIVGSDGTKRPLLKGEPSRLTTQTNFLSSCPVTPRIFFAILLVLVIFITIGEWCWGWKKIARIVDIILLTLEFIVGLVLTYTSLVSNLFTARWNWYLIPCNPLPLLFLALFGRRRWFGKVYLIYTIILVAFMLATPLSSQLDIEHQFIVATFAVRTMSKYLEYRKRRRTQNEPE